MPLCEPRVYCTIGKSASTPSALWTIMPVMPIMAARPLLRSALSLNCLVAGSEYLRQPRGQLRGRAHAADV